MKEVKQTTLKKGEEQSKIDLDSEDEKQDVVFCEYRGVTIFKEEFEQMYFDSSLSPNMMAFLINYMEDQNRKKKVPI